jgi:BlaI family transcriptional regulator, penicillinase repressor
MTSKTPTPSEREIQILKALWRLGEASVREALDVLAPNGELAFNTVQTQLRIMEDKGLVTHRESGRTFIYRALYTREEESSRFLDKVFDGAVQDLVLTLLKSKKIDGDELDALEKLISDSKQTAGVKKNKREAKK